MVQHVNLWQLMALGWTAQDDEYQNIKPCHDGVCRDKALIDIDCLEAEDTGVEPATHCWAIDFESTCEPFAYPPVDTRKTGKVLVVGLEVSRYSHLLANTLKMSESGLRPATDAPFALERATNGDFILTNFQLTFEAGDFNWGPQADRTVPLRSTEGEPGNLGSDPSGVVDRWLEKPTS